MSILVLGATGTVGGHLLRVLHARGVPTRAATRDPDAWTGPGPAVRFDLERPSTFAPALVGVDRVFLIARPGDDHPERLAAPFLAAAREAGVRHVVNLTAMGVEGNEAFGLRKVERLLEASGIAWTHLRPNFFFQVLLAGPLADGIAARGVLALPAADARLSYLDARDVADAAAAALTGPGHAGRAYTLTGGEALDHATIAATLASVSGRPIRYVPLDEDAARAAVTASGLSAERAERLVGFYRVVRAGRCAPVSPDLPALLGRPPRTFAAFAAEHAAAWAT